MASPSREEPTVRTALTVMATRLFRSLGTFRGVTPGAEQLRVFQRGLAAATVRSLVVDVKVTPSQLRPAMLILTILLVLAVPEQPPLFGAEHSLLVFPLKKAGEQSVENLRPDLPLAQCVSSLLNRQDISRKKHFVRPRALKPLLPLSYVVYTG
jgi:hypothetical protein